MNSKSKIMKQTEKIGNEIISFLIKNIDDIECYSNTPHYQYHFKETHFTTLRHGTAIGRAKTLYTFPSSERLNKKLWNLLEEKNNYMAKTREIEELLEKRESLNKFKNLLTIS